jgi:hypothetical protein
MQPARPRIRHLPGELSSKDFLLGVVAEVRRRIKLDELGLRTRQEGTLVKFFADEPAIHFELWLHRGRGRAELALHFETRDAERNRRLLDYVSDELLFLKEALGQGLEPELWDKGWTRLYIIRPLERLGVEEQVQLAEALATFIETLEPIRREAVEAC